MACDSGPRKNGLSWSMTLLNVLNGRFEKRELNKCDPPQIPYLSHTIDPQPIICRRLFVGRLYSEWGERFVV